MAKEKDPAATADKVVRECESRNPLKIARMNKILIRTVEDWKEQSGAYVEMMRQPIIAVTAFVSQFHAVHNNGRAEIDAARIHAEKLFLVFLRGTTVLECCFGFLSEGNERFKIHFRKEIHHHAAGAEIR